MIDFDAFQDELSKIAYAKRIKLAGVLGTLANVAVSQVASNPVKVLNTVGSVASARGNYKQFKAGFDPEAQKVAIGQTPYPGV